MRIEQVAPPAAVAQWSPGRPYLDCELQSGLATDAWQATDDDGVIIGVGFATRASNWRPTPWLTVLGPVAATVAMVRTAIDHQPEITGCTVPRMAHDAVRESLALQGVDWGGPDNGAPWVWWWTDTEPEVLPGEDSVVDLDTSNAEIAESVKALLDVASPTHWAPPGHPAVVRWMGQVVDGQVIACAAETQRIAGRPHLASVATHPNFRRAGRAQAVCATLTRQIISEQRQRGAEPLVSLGMHYDNSAARGVYLRLGYHADYEWFSSGFASMPASAR